MGWRRAAVVLTVTLVVPRCTCAPPCSNHQAPHATFGVTQGCVGYYCAMTCDPGFADCDGNDANGCETSLSALPPNEVVTQETSPSGCNFECVTGFFDCDNDAQNGCESTTPCPDAGDGGEPKGAHVVATMTQAPRGLVACAGKDFFFDGSTLRSIDSTTLALTTLLVSPAPPANGLACDGAYVYWATLSTFDASTPDGELYRLAIGSKVPEVIASGVDPASGIDARDGGVYTMTTSGLSVLPALDAGLALWMPASPSTAYKAFALGRNDDWSLDHATILRRPADGGPSSWIDDAGSPSAILVSSSGEPLVVLHTNDDAGGADFFAYVRDDAGQPTIAAMDASVHPIVATSGGANVVAASDDAIYAVGASGVTALYTSSAHVVDVAVDGTWVVWTTSNPPALWRGAIP